MQESGWKEASSGVRRVIYLYTGCLSQRLGQRRISKSTNGLDRYVGETFYIVPRIEIFLGQPKKVENTQNYQR